VLTGFGISESLGEAKIDDVNVVLFLADTNQKVIGLDVSVKEVTGVYKFNSLKLSSNS